MAIASAANLGTGGGTSQFSTTNRVFFNNTTAELRATADLSLGRGVVLGPGGVTGTLSAAPGATLTLDGALTLHSNMTVAFGSAGQSGTVLFNPSSVGLFSSPLGLVVNAGTLRLAPNSSGGSFLAAQVLHCHRGRRGVAGLQRQRRQRHPTVQPPGGRHRPDRRQRGDPGRQRHGRLSFGSDLSLPAGSLLDLEFGGTAAGTSYDQVLAAGTLTLGGNLRVSAVNGFTLAPAQSFTIIENPGGTAVVAPTFANAPGGLYTDAAGDTFLVSLANVDGGALSNDVTLTVLSVVPEPATWALAGVGSLALAALGLRRHRGIDRRTD